MANFTPELLEEWEGLDTDVKAELGIAVDVAVQLSAMSNPANPRYEEYKRAVELMKQILDV